MGKFKDLWKKGKDGSGSERRSFLIYASFTLIVFIVSAGFLSGNSILRWIKSQLELNRLNSEIADTRQKIDVINREIKDLRDNKDSLEKYARETYGFTEPGDSVYLVK